MYGSTDISHGRYDIENDNEVVVNDNHNVLKSKEDEDNDNESTSAMFSILTALLGVSLFAVPWGFNLSGTIGGTLVISIVSYACYETIRVLLVTQGMLYYKTKKILSYPEMIGYAMDEPWPLVVKCATLISCLGGCIGYLIFLSEICIQTFNLSQTNSIIVATIPLIFLSLLKGFRELASFAVINFGIILVALIVIIMDGLTNSNVIDDVIDAPVFGTPKSTFKFLGPATFTFTIHYMLTAMGAEFLTPRPDTPATTPLSSPIMSTQQPNRSPNRNIRSGNTAVASSSSSSSSGLLHHNSNRLREGMDKHVLLRPLSLAFIISGTIIISFGVLSNAIYRNQGYVWDNKKESKVHPGCEHIVCQNILLNLQSVHYRTFLGILLFPLIFMTYTFVMAPAREHVENYVLNTDFFSQKSDFVKNHVSSSIRVVLVIMTAVVAAINPYFGSTLGAVGGLTDAFQALVLPCIIYLFMMSELGIGSTSNSRGISGSGSGSRACLVQYWLIISFGCCLMTWTMFTIVNGDMN